MRLAQILFNLAAGARLQVCLVLGDGGLQFAPGCAKFRNELLEADQGMTRVLVDAARAKVVLAVLAVELVAPFRVRPAKLELEARLLCNFRLLRTFDHLVN